MEINIEKTGWASVLSTQLYSIICRLPIAHCSKCQICEAYSLSNHAVGLVMNCGFARQVSSQLSESPLLEVRPTPHLASELGRSLSRSLYI